MADNRTMAQMLQAPIEGYEDAIVVPPINANNFELKQPLINLVQSNKFTDFENYVKANDAVLKNVQNQGQNLQNQMANVTSLLTSLCDNFKNSASTSNSGTLPSQTVTNPRQQINAITTRSGKTLEEPSIPLVPSPDVSKPQKEPEQNPETSTEKVQNPNLENTAHVPSPGEEDPKPKAKKTVNVEIQDLNSPRPNSYQSKLPYPERMKVRENDKPSAQHSRFLKMFKQLRLEIGLKDALVEMPKFNKWLSSLLRNKEKLEEIAITTVNAECSAIIMNKVPEKLEDPEKFLIPCALQELDRTSALADSGASINLLPHSIYKQLGLEALTPTRMTLELANRSITHPMGIAEDVVVRVDGFTFLADFVVVNFVPDPRVPIILGRPFLRTAKALIDLYKGTLTLRVGKEELVYYADKSEKNEEKKFFHAISIIDFLKNDPFSGSTTTHSDDPSPSSSPVKTSDNLEEFALRSSPMNSLFLKGIFKKEIFKIIYSFFVNLITNLKSCSTINPIFDVYRRSVEIKNSTDHEPEQNGHLHLLFLQEVFIFTNEFARERLTLPSRKMIVVVNDDSEDEDNELPNLDHQDDPSIPRPPLEPPDVEKCFEPEAGLIQQFLKPLVFGVVSRFTRASYPLFEISLGRSDILSSYRFTSIFAYFINGLDFRRT
ncbi:reverse transcriptase domain-containing protein [Tanacetum coccineum]|uniref:Reverse transcriptase domain-containing protein n=1 Tax=Tanacetum coccineum TaxID=301880 RepID=A0ABQ5J576_9ASTR